MRMGMLRPMNSNDMTKLSLGRPILAAGASAPNRANAPCRDAAASVPDQRRNRQSDWHKQ